MYKKLGVVLLISTLLLSGCSSKKENITPVGIKDLAADPGAYTGKISIEGVVQTVDDKKFLFRLIDEEEFKTCGLNPCGAAGIITIYTPDSTKPTGKTPSDYTYDVKMPKIKDRVTVDGKIKKMDKGYAFEVDKVIKGSDTIIIRK